MEYNTNKEGKKKREYKDYKKKHYKKEAPINREEIKDDVDSDGFEIVGSKEEKKQKFRDEHRGEYVPPRARGKWRKNRGGWKRKDYDREKREDREKKEEKADKESDEEEEKEEEEKDKKNDKEEVEKNEDKKEDAKEEEKEEKKEKKEEKKEEKKYKKERKWLENLNEPEIQKK